MVEAKQGLVQEGRRQKAPREEKLYSKVFNLLPLGHTKNSIGKFLVDAQLPMRYEKRFGDRCLAVTVN
ncbi:MULTISPECIES: hypothetical protein [unclassified Coleofasciculus]|uniref:hypothetical protein n=1 Tax=unclassified Coleofasciculus TaxID=2692782 RepID=UPI00188199BA|nr:MULTISPECIES: hypothetical protein [unclassified Coleofasciculus]MBE9127151.1 hypothetical protein [Coleofasciculus sp. LEGE 07081]MBE9150288.1 hypothetical protein [Coleofasciculus sp. LEGE 07092]